VRLLRRFLRPALRVRRRAANLSNARLGRNSFSTIKGRARYAFLMDRQRRFAALLLRGWKSPYIQ
jgi:hypothetical protein